MLITGWSLYFSPAFRCSFHSFGYLFGFSGGNLFVVVVVVVVVRIGAVVSQSRTSTQFLSSSTWCRCVRCFTVSSISFWTISHHMLCSIIHHLLPQVFLLIPPSPLLHDHIVQVLSCKWKPFDCWMTGGLFSLKSNSYLILSTLPKAVVPNTIAVLCVTIASFGVSGNTFHLLTCRW